MKANNAARVATKQQLEVLVSKLNEYTKRKPLYEAETGVVGAPAPGPAASAPAPAQGQQPPVQASPASGAAGQDQTANDQKVDGVPTIKNVIDQLNALRSGRSLKDAEVKTELERYFEGLEDSEKEAMHAYFKGVAQILSGQVDGGAAEEPKSHGVATQASGKRTKNIKPNVIRKSTPKTPPASAGAAASAVAAKPPRENTAPPAPIVPKKR
jgi:hypothetical protein